MVKEITIESLEHFLSEISDFNEFEVCDMVFRGQSDANWEVESTAYRRLKNMNDDNLLKYNQELIERARRYRGGEFEEDLDDLPLLAKLQHHGAATVLIDFTRSAMIALWFACQKIRDEDGKEVKKAGKVFCLDVNPTNGRFRQITRKNEKQELSKLFDWLEKVDNEITVWGARKTATFTPPLDNRVLQQDSQFIFNTEGRLNDDEFQKIFIIPWDNKPEILQQLKDLHNLSEETIFPDFYGFAQNNNFREHYGPQTATEIFEVALKYYLINDYKRAVELFGRAIGRKPNFIRAFLCRGNANIDLKLYHDAIADFHVAIDLTDMMEVRLPDEDLHYRYSAYAGLVLANQGLGLDDEVEKYTAKADELMYKLSGDEDEDEEADSA